jgi:hypothetical protein
MADIVIYEDSPLAQYLQGNNQPSVQPRTLVSNQFKKETISFKKEKKCVLFVLSF